MCNLSRGVEERGIAKGCAEGRIEATSALIRNLMDSTGFSLERAMSVLKISDEERDKYAKLLTKQ